MLWKAEDTWPDMCTLSSQWTRSSPDFKGHQPKHQICEERSHQKIPFPGCLSLSSHWCLPCQGPDIKETQATSLGPCLDYWPTEFMSIVKQWLFYTKSEVAIYTAIGNKDSLLSSVPGAWYETGVEGYFVELGWNGGKAHGKTVSSSEINFHPQSEQYE